MCGVFGCWREAPIALAPVLEALHGRGPDDRGEATWPLGSGWLQLAHTRLAIQDLSPAGHQPMVSADGERHIVFNGEIYNAPELRQELEAAGLRFRSHSDTEVILEGHGLWGDALWPRLNGIFAVALVDQRRGHLTLARDRFGVKPLLWHRTEQAFAFGSELSAFKAAGMPARPRLDRVALDDFWQWGAVPAPRTIVEGIEVFPAGCLARWRLGQCASRWEIDRYARLPVVQLSSADLSYGEAVKACREALEAAVGRQLLADVPVGAFLSGGLDSTAIVALMRQCSSTIPDTFSLGFEQADASHRVVDERSLARRVAQACGTHHHELVIGFEEAVAAVPEFCRAIDQPSVDGFNTFLVARAARRHGLKVALSGLGGDELLAGYPVFQRAWSYSQAPHVWHGWQAQLPWRLQQRVGWQAARFRHGSVEALASHRRLHRNPSGRQGPSLSVETEGLLSAEELQLDLVAQLSRLELRGYMVNTLLRDSDAVSMHQGLELRVPFLDQPLVELLLRLPTAYKFRAGCNKPLLVDAMGAALPEEIVGAPKRGFELPFGAWLQAMAPSPLDAAVLGPLWATRIRSAKQRFNHRASSYHGWWQWQVLSRWLEGWPQLLDF